MNLSFKATPQIPNGLAARKFFSRFIFFFSVYHMFAGTRGRDIALNGHSFSVQTIPPPIPGDDRILTILFKINVQFVLKTCNDNFELKRVQYPISTPQAPMNKNVIPNFIQNTKYLSISSKRSLDSRSRRHFSRRPISALRPAQSPGPRSSGLRARKFPSQPSPCLEVRKRPWASDKNAL